jgi:hypothetical protein
MKENHKKLLDQFSKMASDGMFGDQIKASQAEFDQMPNAIAVSVKLVADFYSSDSSEIEEMTQIRDLICQTLIVAYREARRENLQIAETFLYSFFQDFPGVSESLLMPRWCSLAQAGLAAREVAHSKNRLLIWQQTCKLFQSYSEFLNGLFPYLIILWKTSQKKSFELSVFSSSYANKINQFEAITGGDDGKFSILCRIAKPKIRNAIAHETIWFDPDEEKVRFIDGSNKKAEYEIDLSEFIGYATVGSHLAYIYLAAISAIVVMENYPDFAKSFLPLHLVKLFNHQDNLT